MVSVPNNHLRRRMPAVAPRHAGSKEHSHGSHRSGVEPHPIRVRGTKLRNDPAGSIRVGIRKATLGAGRNAAAAAGVLVVPRVVNGAKVTRAEMQQAVAALRLLPAADLAMIARQGIQIHLHPVSGLEDGLLGATTIVQEDSDGPWRPTLIRVAVRANLSGSQSLGEIVQHEFGHAVSVIRKQDRSEDAAIAYARKY